MGSERCPIFQMAERVPGHCDGCGEPLPGRRRRWCSDPCWERYFYNHGWTAARYEALRRAEVRDARIGPREQVGWRPCDNCGRDTSEGRHGGPYYGHRDLPSAPEVNHVEPRRGAGYDEGCHNHQTNLQVLCHACHLIETADQRLSRSVGLALDMGEISANEAIELLAGRAVARLAVAHPNTPGVGLDLILPLWPAA